MEIPDVPPALLTALSEAAGGKRLALVGGVVRDLLLHRHHQDPWRGLPDLDLVVEGRAADLVQRLPQALQQQLGQAVPLLLHEHGRYGTFELELTMPGTRGGPWLVDLASARTEVYAQPGQNPQVSPGSLEQDLSRRDFTVNAIAFVLDPQRPGVALLDPHGGQADLAKRQLRFLHPDSLADDPTRLVRAARYAARLGLDLAPEALQQVRATVAMWPWSWRLGDPPEMAPAALAIRLRMELQLLLEREPWVRALEDLKRWGGLQLLDPQLEHRQGWLGRLHWAHRFDLPLLLALVANTQDPQSVSSRLQLPLGQQRWLSQMLELEQRLQQQDHPCTPSAWAQLLEGSGLSPQAVALALIRGQQPRQALLSWWARWRHVRAPVTARSLLAEGWVPGPALGEELDRRRALALDLDGRSTH